MTEDNKSKETEVEEIETFYGYTLESRAELQPLKPTEKSGIENNEKVLNSRKKCTDFEEILNLIGSEGKYQKFLLYAILCPIVTVSPFLCLNALFILDIPDHWCHVPGNYSDLQLWKNLTIPIETGPDGLARYSQCSMYELSDSSGNNETTSCQFGWDYDKSDYEHTIPSEFNWVCDKVGYATDSFTWSNVGSAVGTVIFGILADKFGRKNIFFISCLVNLTFRLSSYFVPQYIYPFLTLHFLAGTAFPALFSMTVLLTAEVCSTEFRSWTYAVTWMIWVLGNSLLPLVVWLCRGWFLLGWLTAIPGLLLFLYYPIMDESPRWLITVEKGDQALEIIMKIAKSNGRDGNLNRSEMAQMVGDLIEKQREDKAKRNIGVWTLFQTYNLAKNTIMLCITWSLNMILYYGITLNTTRMAGNKFLNYFLLSIIELPSGYLGGILLEKTGRRWTQAGFFLLCTFSCFICAFAVISPHLSYNHILVIIGALGIKFGVTITSMVVYLQGVEIFPTPLRSTGNGLASTVSSIIGIMGPHIVFTGKINAALPYTILGILSALGFLASASLPETFRMHLPETIEDANTFGKGEKFWSYLPDDNRKNPKNNNNNNNTKEPIN